MPTASAPAELIARERAPTTVAAVGSYASWSRYDRRTRRFRLAIWHAGRLRLAHVAPSDTPYDVSLGFSSGGTLTAVYSRCRRTAPPLSRFTPYPQLSRACDLFEYSIRDHRERRLAGPSRPRSSEFLPSIAGNRLLFARAQRRRPDGQPRLATLVEARLHPYRERRLPLPDGPASKIADLENLGVASTALDGSTAAVLRQYTAKHGACDLEVEGLAPRVEEIWLYDLARGTRRLLVSNCKGPAGSFYTTPTFVTGALYFALIPADSDRYSLTRMDLATGAQSSAGLSASLAHILNATQSTPQTTWTSVNELFHGHHTTAIYRNPNPLSDPWSVRIPSTPQGGLRPRPARFVRRLRRPTSGSPERGAVGDGLRARARVAPRHGARQEDRFATG